jgi:hypothetical protein
MNRQDKPKLVTLDKEPVGTGYRLSLRCTTCSQTFALSICHHVTCKECGKAYCPEYKHECLPAT